MKEFIGCVGNKVLIFGHIISIQQGLLSEITTVTNITEVCFCEPSLLKNGFITIITSKRKYDLFFLKKSHTKFKELYDWLCSIVYLKSNDFSILNSFVSSKTDNMKKIDDIVKKMHEILDDEREKNNYFDNSYYMLNDVNFHHVERALRIWSLPQDYVNFLYQYASDCVRWNNDEYYNLDIADANNLEFFQEGYSYNSISNELLVEWPENFLVIAVSEGDPFCIDLNTENSPVYSAAHGQDEWKFYIDSNSIIEFLQKVIQPALPSEESETQSLTEETSLQESFAANLKWIHKDTFTVEEIQRLLIENDDQISFMMGEVNFPTGKVMVADPLVYLYDLEFSKPLDLRITPGNYPVFLNIHNSKMVGLRVISAMLKIKDDPAVRYETAMPEGVRFDQCDEPGVLAGFGVDAGMACFCDYKTATEYAEFIQHWHSENPDKNHYVDYFAIFFEQSYKNAPDVQSKDGDFILWSIPETGNKIAMFSSGLGDGLYLAQWGFDKNNEICQLVIPFMNPDCFKNNENKTRHSEKAPKFAYSSEDEEIIKKHILSNFGDEYLIYGDKDLSGTHPDIYIIKPRPEHDYYTLVTMGMGSRKMSVPQKYSTYAVDRIELVLNLPPDWDIQNGADEWKWPLIKMREWTVMPFNNNYWVGYGHSISNGGPYAENTKLCSMAMTHPYSFGEKAETCVLANGDKVKFYQVVLLYDNEMSYMLDAGVNLLISHFINNMHLSVEVDRPNVICEKEWCKKSDEMKFLYDSGEKDRCFITNRILVDGCKVGYMEREEPMPEEDGLKDSGWRFYSDDEPEDYWNNNENSGFYFLNTIANFDPDVIPFLDAPIGSAFYRDENNNFVEYIDDNE